MQSGHAISEERMSDVQNAPKHQREMKILFDLKCRIPSITFCYKNKEVIIRYWGKLKFQKVVLYDA
jgi:hypothetical protein